MTTARLLAAHCLLALWLPQLLPPVYATPCTDTFVRRSAGGRDLEYQDAPLFLNGINLAWVSWGIDFESNGEYGNSLGFYCAAESAMRFLKQNGGNSLRLWLGEEPQQILTYHRKSGRVAGLRPGVIEAVQTVLELAATYDILVVLVLFNGALVRNQPDQEEDDCQLFNSSKVLTSLVNNAIEPLAAALRGYRSLAMYEVINEPEGVLDTSLPDGGTPCTNFRSPALVCPGQQSQPGFSTNDPQATCRFSMSQLQAFVNRIAAGLKYADPYHLVTMGSWSHCVSSAGPGGAVNLWSAQCLVEAGGEASGTLDVAQMHTYPKFQNGAEFNPEAPLNVHVMGLGLNVPVIIGELSTRWDDRPNDLSTIDPTVDSSMADLYRRARVLGYSGVFGWQYFCDPHIDGGCVSHEALADGLRCAPPVAHLPLRVVDHLAS